MEIKQKSELEFIIVMASLMSLVALSIDALLPAIADISKAIHIVNPKNNQLFITMIFLGLGFGQLFQDLYQIVLAENQLFMEVLSFLLLLV